MVRSVYQPQAGAIDWSHYAETALRIQEWELQSDNSADEVAMMQLWMPQWHLAIEFWDRSCRDATKNAETAMNRSCRDATKSAKDKLPWCN